MGRSMPYLVLALAVVPLQAGAQVAWEAPPLLRAGSPAGVSVLLLSPEPGDGIGVVAAWRRSEAPTGLGFRVGVAEGPGDEVAALVGVDVSGTLASPSGAGSPSVLWWTGAGVGVGDDLLASFPLGLTLGWVGSDEGVSFMPYLGGHVVLDVFTGPGDDLDLDGAVDLGLDVGFGSGFQVRFGGSVGGREALAIGARIPSS